jgi:hypothetical protein
VLARALENDLDSFVIAWNPAPAPRAREIMGIAGLFVELEEKERLQKSGSRHG